MTTRVDEGNTEKRHVVSATARNSVSPRIHRQTLQHVATATSKRKDHREVTLPPHAPSDTPTTTEGSLRPPQTKSAKRPTTRDQRNFSSSASAKINSYNGSENGSGVTPTVQGFRSQRERKASVAKSGGNGFTPPAIRSFTEVSMPLLHQHFEKNEQSRITKVKEIHQTDFKKIPQFCRPYLLRM